MLCVSGIGWKLMKIWVALPAIKESKKKYMTLNGNYTCRNIQQLLKVTFLFSLRLYEFYSCGQQKYFMFLILFFECFLLPIYTLNTQLLKVTLMTSQKC